MKLQKFFLALVLVVVSVFAGMAMAAEIVTDSAGPSYSYVGANYNATIPHNNTHLNGGSVDLSYMIPGTDFYLFGTGAHNSAPTLSEGNSYTLGAGVRYSVSQSTDFFASGNFVNVNVFSKTSPNVYGEEGQLGVRSMLSDRLEGRLGADVVHYNQNTGSFNNSTVYYGKVGASYEVYHGFALTSDVRVSRQETDVTAGVRYQF